MLASGAGHLYGIRPSRQLEPLHLLASLTEQEEGDW